MSLFQEPAETSEELEASKPLDIPPEQVGRMRRTRHSLSKVG